MIEDNERPVSDREVLDTILDISIRLNLLAEAISRLADSMEAGRERWEPEDYR